MRVVASSCSIKLREALMTVDFSMPILVVEDMPLMGRIVSALLKEIGFRHVDLAQGSFTASTECGLLATGS
jgi:hypothetical protein